MNRKSRLISVVIPVANGERHLHACINSALNQTYREFEVVVANDASTDSTAEIIEHFKTLDSRVRSVELPVRSGVAAARNAAIAESTGAMIAPLDADDIWHPTKLAKQLAAMIAGGCDTGLVYCWIRRVDDAGEFLSKGPQLRIEGDIANQLMRRSFTGGGSTALMRAELVHDVGGYDSKYFHAGVQGSEDTDLYLKLALRSKAAVVPEALVDYRQSENSMSSNRRQLLEAGLAVRRNYVDRIPGVVPETTYANLHLLEAISPRAIGRDLRKTAFRRAVSLDRLVIPRALVSRHNWMRFLQHTQRVARLAIRRSKHSPAAHSVAARRIDSANDAKFPDNLPLVSIVVPVFNQEQYVEETIRSVATQSYPNIEIIAVDDQSTDDSALILTRLSGEIPIMTVISQRQNGGVCVARNAGINRANGEFVLPLDADDVLHPDAISTLVAARYSERSKGDTVTLTYGALVKIESDGTLDYRRQPLTSPPKDVEGFGLCEANIVGSGSGPLICTRTLKSIGGYDETLRRRFGEGSADWVMYLELASRGTFASTADVIVGYRRSDESMSADAKSMYRSYDAVEQTIERLFPGRVADFGRARAKLLFASALDSLKRREFKPAIKLFRRCINTDRKTGFSRLKLLSARVLRRTKRRVRHHMHVGFETTGNKPETSLPVSDYFDLLCPHDPDCTR